MAVRALLVLVALAVLYGCGQASSPDETLDDYDSDCRFAEYALDASLQQSDKAFARLADTIEMNVNASDSELNKQKNETLDEMNVPRYPECKIGGE
jgi:U3 small nucleolar RNA-associated protein 14